MSRGIALPFHDIGAEMGVGCQHHVPKGFVYIYVNTSQNFAENFKCFRHQLQRKSKHMLCSVPYPSPRKQFPLLDFVYKYGRAGVATDENVIRRMRIACGVTKTYTHTRAHARARFSTATVVRGRSSIILRKYIIFHKLVGGSQKCGSAGSPYELHILLVCFT